MPEVTASLTSRPTAVSARAPGRLDVMGGIGDYSGSLVLQLPLDVATRTTVEFEDDATTPGFQPPPRKGDYRVESGTRGAAGSERRFSISIDQAEEVLTDYETARSYFAERADDHWASYVLGCLTVLHVEESVAFPPGLSIRIMSDVPEGKGISSSAALEVSVMGGLVRLLRIELPLQRMARLCQIVENRVAGAPCGIMDQMTSTCGRKDHLLALLCRPAEVMGQVAIPSEVALWGIDSGIRHSVGGSDYSSVRAAAAMGYRIIADREGLPVEQLGPGRVRIEDRKFHGYLAALGSTRLADHLSSLPVRMSGSAFLNVFGGISDETVAVEPSRTYRIRDATSHPVFEHERSERFASLLQEEPSKKAFAMMGELMYLSHAGYSACGLGSEGTDRIVELVREVGYHKGLYGARITGGGSGGTVAVLGSSHAGETIRRIARRYEEETGLESTVFEGSSDGLRVS